MAYYLIRPMNAQIVGVHDKITHARRNAKIYSESKHCQIIIAKTVEKYRYGYKD